MAEKKIENRPQEAADKVLHQTGKKTGSKNGKRKVRKYMRARLILLAFGTLIILVLFFFLVFQVRNVEVNGNSKFSDDEIRQMVLEDPMSNNSILAAIFRSHVDKSDIAFMDSIDISYVSNDTIAAEVTEKKPVGYLSMDNNLVYFDKDGVVVEILQSDTVYPDYGTPSDSVSGDFSSVQSESDSTEDSSEEETLTSSDIRTARVTVSEFHPSLENVPLVTGIYVSDAQENQKLDVSDPAIFRTLLALIRMIEKYSIPPESVEIAEDGSLILHYYQSVRINLGEDEELEEKMTKLAAILPQLKGLTGTLHMEDYSDVDDSFVFDQEE